MKKPQAKAERPLPNPRQVLNQAIRFMAAEKYLRGVSDLNMLRDFGTPTVVMAAFAAELLLKTLHILESQSLPETHNLHTLFKRLPNKRKQRIMALWERVAPARERRLGNIEAFARANLPGLSGVSLPRDLRTSLVQCGDAFERGDMFMRTLMRSSTSSKILRRSLSTWFLKCGLTG